MNNYYCLVAGLPEITLEDSKLSIGLTELRRELRGELTKDDAKLLDLYFYKKDNANLLRFLADREATLEDGGCYSAEEFSELLQIAEDGELDSSEKFPGYMFAFLSDYAQENRASQGETQISLEDLLASHYNDYLMSIKHPFFKAWFELNQNINNIFAALSARKYGIEVASVIVGNSSVANQLRSSNLRDFGLSNSVDDLSQLFKIFEEGDLVERERQLDLYRWSWLEEQTALFYFSIEVVLAFVLKVEMVDRWLKLDKAKGEQMFRRLIQGLKDEVVLPDEFK